jgi:hypothetical protein
MSETERLVNASKEPLGLVFSVPIEGGAGPSLVADPQTFSNKDENSYTVAVIRFNDCGHFMGRDAGELKAATARIDAIRRGSGNKGMVVVVFIHGWHHGASWDIVTDGGDKHFSAFRDILLTLSRREQEKWGSSVRHVVGIYMTWNGDPVGSWRSRVPVLTDTTFWNRYRTAKRIGEGEDLRRALEDIVERTKKPIPNQPGLADSPLILMGHSMGALILETAFLSILSETPEKLIHPYESTAERPVRLTQNGKSVSFPDLVLLLNSAADSRIAKRINDILIEKDVRKTVASAKVGFLPPLLVSATSPKDLPTRLLWRLANWPWLWPWVMTDGHNKSLFTHQLVNNGEETLCPAAALNESAKSFGQPWHCLRYPDPLKDDFPSFSIALPKTIRLRENDAEVPQHIHYVLKPIVKKKRLFGSGNHHATLKNPHPFWIFRLPPDISGGHNDVFNFRSRLLALAMMQISGAIVSLATKWEGVFESEPQQRRPG